MQALENPRACCRDRVGLENRVRSRVSRRVAGLQVVMVERGVVLRGQACSYYVKQLAQHAVMETTDLPIIANEIEVSQARKDPTGSDEPSDWKELQTTGSKET